jgi:hypothetical protein
MFSIGLVEVLSLTYILLNTVGKVICATVITKLRKIAQKV